MKKLKTKAERWKSAKYIKDDGTVLDFTGLYEVSNYGHVRSLNYKRSGKTKVMILHTSKDICGAMFYLVNLYKDKKRNTLQVHRLVLSSFKKRKYRHGDVVNHKSERTPTSCINKLSNLEWITQKENTNTEHCKSLHINHPALSKRVRATNRSTGEITIYPSASEAGRALGIDPCTPAVCICKNKGYCKKLNICFKYV